MKQNIECPKCGAQMERKEHPERDVCPYCDTIVYPKKREVTSAPLPPSQHIYIHMPGVVTPLKEEPKETSWQMEEELSVNDGNEEEDNGGSGHTIFIIVIIVALLLFGMLI